MTTAQTTLAVALSLVFLPWDRRRSPRCRSYGTQLRTWHVAGPLPRHRHPGSRGSLRAVARAGIGPARAGCPHGGSRCGSPVPRRPARAGPARRRPGPDGGGVAGTAIATGRRPGCAPHRAGNGIDRPAAHGPLVRRTVGSVEYTATSLVSRVAGDLGSVADEVIADVVRCLRRELPELWSNPDLARMTSDNVAEHVVGLLAGLECGIEPSEMDPSAAELERARRLAWQGTPVTVLLRAFRLGQGVVLDRLLAEMPRLTKDAELINGASRLLLAMASGYVDDASEQGVTAFQEEEGRLPRGHRAVSPRLHGSPRRADLYRSRVGPARHASGCFGKYRRHSAPSPCGHRRRSAAASP
ncbi:hypothetical protein SsS58_03109 [Streptomyces scabiei]|uniref:RsbT co-antagonist protein RsbRD N-terminal domain-containing protein n=1 Tax=Streptomyces scabiei TaxID=1930 RepID=A0A100JNE4_STRSC|nr:hypothetical protein SsS58_03109 [Streptomyces scabiei]